MTSLFDHLLVRGWKDWRSQPHESSASTVRNGCNFASAKLDCLTIDCTRSWCSWNQVCHRLSFCLATVNHSHRRLVSFNVCDCYRNADYCFWVAKPAKFCGYREPPLVLQVYLRNFCPARKFSAETQAIVVIIAVLVSMSHLLQKLCPL
jgi:hypothetical protein